MTPGLTEDLQEIIDARRTAIIDLELERLKMDIVALQETRLLESGSVRTSTSFYWKGKARDETRTHGVGFAIRNTLLSSITPATDGTERLLTLQLCSSTGPVNLICAYASTLTSTPEEQPLQTYLKKKHYSSSVTSTPGLAPTKAPGLLALDTLELAR